MAPRLWYPADDQLGALVDQTELAVYLVRIDYLRPNWSELSHKLEPLVVLNESDVWDWNERCARCYQLMNLC